MAHFLASLTEISTRTLDHVCAGAELIGESADRLLYGGIKPNGTSDPIAVLFRFGGLSFFIVASMFVGGLIGLLTGGIRGLFVGMADGFWVSAFRDSSGSHSRIGNPFP